MDMERNFKKFLSVTLGSVLMSIGFYFFLVPSHLVTGGVTGLALIINSLIPNFPTGGFMILINIVLFILAFIFIGKEFGGYTMYSSFLISGLITLLEYYFPHVEPLTDDLLINLLYGILINGLGYAFIFSQNASTGGTDIVAKIINKFTHIDMGKALFLSDFSITVLAGLIFGPKLGLYALLGILLNSMIIDKLLAGFNVRINMTINSVKNQEINDYILHELIRGTTIYYARGGFSNDEKTIINTIVTRKEYLKIKQFVKEIDPLAFISISFVNEVLGEGFSYHRDNKPTK